MTHGLYDQIGAQRQADLEALRAAYSRTLARLTRRRRDLLDQGGDTAQLDLVRSQVEEAWQVLSEPARRRRYDALLALSEGGGLPSPGQVWERANGVLVSPGSAAAVELLRAATGLDLPALDPVPGAPEPPASGFGADTQADIPTEAVPGPEHVARRMTGDPPPVVMPAPRARPADTPPATSTPTPPPATPRPVGIGVPSPAATAHGASLDDWVAELGWSGALIRRVREHKGLSLRDVGDATRISARYLEAIEADDHDQLPSSTFVKGYLREIARLLDLEESSLVAGYLRQLS